MPLNDYDCDYSTLYDEDVRNAESDAIANDHNIVVNDYEPKDRYHFVRITFCVLGLAQLIPWNFLITATDYWMHKFRYVNQTDNTFESSRKWLTSDKTELQTFFDSYLSIASNLPFIVVLVLNAFLGHKLREEIRNIVSLTGVIILFFVITIYVKTNTDSYQIKFFTITMVCVALMNAFSACLQGSISGLASVFPSHCMHAMVTGQGIAGLFAAFAQLLTLVWNWDATQSAFYYFMFADFILIVSFVMYCLIYRTEYYKYHKEEHLLSRRQLLDSFPVNVSNSRTNITELLAEIWPHCISIMLVFWVSIALFPAVTVLMLPINSRFNGKYFLPITCFLLFNLSDFLGRITARKLSLPLKRRYLLLYSALLRVILVPLIMLCNIQPRSHLPVLFTNEYYYILFMISLGLSNGYVFGNAMMNGTMFVSPQFRESAGFFLVAFLGLGLSLGAFSSNFLLRIL